MSDMTPEKSQTSQTPSKSTKNPAGYDLYIMRHGKAVRRGPHYSDDAKRPLTAQGIRDLQKITNGLIRSGVVVDWIVSSPLVRAKETAQILAESLAPQVAVEFTETLSPGGTAEALLTLLAKHSARTSTLVVGHEPGLSELACRLIGANLDAGLALKKGGCCLITFSGLPQLSKGRLLWWLTPRVLRKMG
jgi:phosphohistidine phosphatase